MPNRLGFSTGVLFKSIPSTSVQIISRCADLGCRTIEIACVRKMQLFYFPQIIKPSDLLFPFNSRSLHLPTDMRYGNDNETKMVLSMARDIQNKFRFSHMVIHPDLVDNWEVLRMTGLPIAVENMDHRKNCFKTLSDIQALLNEQLWVDFVFDVNHWASNGNNLDSVPNFLQYLDRRLAGIHLSGFDEFHEPLHITKQHALIDSISKVNVPITIESVLSEVSDMRHEQLYVSDALSGNA